MKPLNFGAIKFPDFVRKFLFVPFVIESLKFSLPIDKKNGNEKYCFLPFRGVVFMLPTNDIRKLRALQYTCYQLPSCQSYGMHL